MWRTTRFFGSSKEPSKLGEPAGVPGVARAVAGVSTARAGARGRTRSRPARRFCIVCARGRGGRWLCPRVRRLRARRARPPAARGGGGRARARRRARPEPRAGPRRGRARRRHRLFRLFKRTLQKGFVFPTRHASAVDPRGGSAGRTRRRGRGFGSEARRPRRTSDAGDVRGASAGAECLGPSRRVDFKTNTAAMTGPFRTHAKKALERRRDWWSRTFAS